MYDSFTEQVLKLRSRSKNQVFVFAQFLKLPLCYLRINVLIILFYYSLK